jgi:TetR/AcrR family transcriptional repressor of nem operon
MRATKRNSSELHQKILKAAAPFLKRHGTDGAPVDEIMKTAGLTSGALYSHFKNKEDLCTQATCSALDAVSDAYRTIVRERGTEGLELIVSHYLSEAHARDVPGGCTFAALGSDMAKATPRAKRAYELRIHALVQIFVDGLGAGSETKRRAKAQHILSTMLGALTFARAMSDPDASVAFLSQVRSQVLSELKELSKQ